MMNNNAPLSSWSIVTISFDGMLKIRSSLDGTLEKEFKILGTGFVDCAARENLCYVLHNNWVTARNTKILFTCFLEACERCPFHQCRRLGHW